MISIDIIGIDREPFKGTGPVPWGISSIFPFGKIDISQNNSYIADVNIFWKTSMRKNAREVGRPRGRPQLRPDGETRRLLIQAADEEFRANGYASSVMGAVARRAGVSTKTLYRLIPTKAELFRNVVSERMGRFMLAIDPDTLDATTFPAALERFLIAYGELMFAEQTIGMHRLVLGESQSFPELAAAFYE
jgi:AcrR family transcriptional regulator